MHPGCRQHVSPLGGYAAAAYTLNIVHCCSTRGTQSLGRLCCGVQSGRSSIHTRRPGVCHKLQHMAGSSHASCSWCHGSQPHNKRGPQPAGLAQGASSNTCQHIQFETAPAITNLVVHDEPGLICAYTYAMPGSPFTPTCKRHC